MANGKGTVDCFECEHHFFKPGVHDMFCSRWKLRLYRGRYGSLNMLCRDYRATKSDGPVLGALAPFMEPAILYAIPYPAAGWHDHTQLRVVRNMKTRRFLDGHPRGWEAGG